MSFSPFSLGKTGWEGEEEGLCCMQSGGSNAQSSDRRWASPQTSMVLHFCVCSICWNAPWGRRVDAVIFHLARLWIEFPAWSKLVSKQGKGTVRWVEKWLDCRGQRLHQQHEVQLEAGYLCWSQGLKPALFKDFINDLDDRLECSLEVHGQKEIAVRQVYLIFWKSGCLQRDLNRLEKGTGWKGTLWHSTKANGKSCIWDRITCAAVQAGGNKTESSFPEKDLRAVSQWYALAARKANHTLSCSSWIEGTKSMEGIFLLYSAAESTHWSTLPNFDLSSSRQTMAYRTESPGGPAWLFRGLENRMYVDAERMGLIWPQEKVAKREFSLIPSLLNGKVERR